MQSYQIEFGKVGDIYPVPPLTLELDDINVFCRAVAEHAIPYLRPALTAMGRPELADCFFAPNKERTSGEFIWLDLPNSTGGVRFCSARLTAVD